MTEAYDPLDSIGDEWKGFAGGMRADYEARVVRKVLAALDAAAMARDLGGRSRSRTGQASLTFAALAEALPNLPVRLAVSRKLKKVHEVAADDLFKKFAKTPFVAAFVEMYEEGDGDERPLAVAFKWPRVSDFMVVHSAGPGSVSGSVYAARRLRLAGAGPDGLEVTVETLEAFLGHFFEGASAADFF